ncbi:hypothetical protein MMC10_001984 [Thelotrema lepadinum]|nr:hypothetical protein [Thelotrema lepadinum]
MALATGPSIPSKPLNVIALISGGKDSFLSLLYCLEHGHNVVALANLYPPSQGNASTSSEVPSLDLNSHMYQTAGHSLIDLYAQAISIPLYRGSINGTAVSKEKEYVLPSTSGTLTDGGSGVAEETEDLLPLLRRIQAHHPEANALSSGAILSTYQRTRVESVCSRLGLTSLAFLWQWPLLPSPTGSPGALLEDGANVGLDARIVKVASGGLDETFLWESLADTRVRRRVEKAVGRFGGSVLGEGGEYETLVVSGPKGLWRGRLEVEDRERVVRRGEGGEAWMEFDGGSVVEFGAEDDGKEVAWMKRLRVPGLWDGDFERILKEDTSTGPLQANRETKGKAQWDLAALFGDHGSTLSLSNLTALPEHDRPRDQMASINSSILACLKALDTDPSNIVFTTILLRCMSDFSAINSIYGQLFATPNPPARVTVACGDYMPAGKHVMVSILVHKRSREERGGLHVQSRSYWAPANIGPYSQAISVNSEPPPNDDLSKVVYIAGQIPLVPSTMQIFAGEGSETQENLFRKQALLSLQHLWRIGTEMDVNWWSGGIAFLAGKANADPSVVALKARIAWSLWKRLHKLPAKEDDADEDADDVPGPDAWDLKYGGMGSLANEEAQKRPLPDFASVQLESPPVTNESSNTSSPEYLIPGFFAVEVEELPRSCSIEWQGAGYSGSRFGLYEGPADHNWSIRSGVASEALPPSSSGNWSETRSTLYHSSEPASIPNDRPPPSTSTSFVSTPLPTISSFSDPNAESSTAEEYDLREPLKNAINSLDWKILGDYTAQPIITVYTPFPSLFSSRPVQVVPCSRVWGVRGGRLERIGAGMVIRPKDTH